MMIATEQPGTQIIRPTRKLDRPYVGYLTCGISIAVIIIGISSISALLF